MPPPATAETRRKLRRSRSVACTEPPCCLQELRRAGDATGMADIVTRSRQIWFHDSRSAGSCFAKLAGAPFPFSSAHDNRGNAIANEVGESAEFASGIYQWLLGGCGIFNLRLRHLSTNDSSTEKPGKCSIIGMHFMSGRSAAW